MQSCVSEGLGFVINGRLPPQASSNAWLLLSLFPPLYSPDTRSRCSWLGAAALRRWCSACHSSNCSTSSSCLARTALPATCARRMDGYVGNSHVYGVHVPCVLAIPNPLAICRQSWPFPVSQLLAVAAVAILAFLLSLCFWVVPLGCRATTA